MKIPAFALLVFCISGPAFATEAKTDVVDEGGIRDKWTLADGTKLAVPAYPDGFAMAQRDVCVALGYQVNPDGTTSGFRVLKQWNSQTQAVEPVDGFWNGFANAGADAVGQWKFKPRPEVATPAPVFTVATLTWQTRRDTNRDMLRAQCRIDDLVAFMRNDQRKRGLNDHEIERTALRRENRVQTFAGTPKNAPGMKP